VNVEQRLVEAFRSTEAVEPSPDLWARVVHSIDEDRRHRRRVVAVGATIVGTFLALAGVAVAGLRDSPFGRYVHRPTLEVLELLGLVVVVAALGPAIRRFGRGYADDLWPAASTVPQALLRLLDLAYALVFSGYILVTVELEFDHAGRSNALAGQVAEAAQRLGGLLLVIGLLHAATLVLLPVVALIDNSTRVQRPLPRWLVVVGAVAAVPAIVLVLLLTLGALIAGLSSS
jgi:hypothetical protein